MPLPITPTHEMLGPQQADQSRAPQVPGTRRSHSSPGLKQRLGIAHLIILRTALAAGVQIAVPERSDPGACVCRAHVGEDSHHTTQPRLIRGVICSFAEGGMVGR